MRLRKFRQGYELLLEWITITLMVTLAAVVTAGVAFRYAGSPLVWYDEVATILLAWVTFYGSALAVLKHAHMGVPELVRMMPRSPRIAVTLFAQACTLAFFVVLAWAGFSVLEILATDNLVSIPKLNAAHTNSVIPVSAVLFIIGQVLVFPEVYDEAVRGDIVKAEELI